MDHQKLALIVCEYDYVLCFVYISFWVDENQYNPKIW